jgi:hypothetical protein
MTMCSPGATAPFPSLLDLDLDARVNGPVGGIPIALRRQDLGNYDAFGPGGQFGKVE